MMPRLDLDRAREDRRRGALAAAILALIPWNAWGGPLGTSERPQLPLEGVITNPDWAQRPSAEDVARFYPPLAAALRLSGRAEISCVVTTLGALSGCSVAGEVPAGMGFGPAALSLSNLFRMKPQMLDGQPVPGGGVRIPIHFGIPADADGPPGQSEAESAPASTAPSPSAMALGRRLMVALSGDPANGEAVEGAVNQLRGQLQGSAPTREQQLVFDDYRQVVTAALSALTEKAARGYVESLPEPQLAQAVSFLESPAGKAFLLAGNVQRKAEAAEWATQYKIYIAEVRSRLCRQITCLDPSAPTPAPQKAAPGAPATGARKP